MATLLILGQKVKVRGHKVQKHISDDRVAGVSLHSNFHLIIIMKMYIVHRKNEK